MHGELVSFTMVGTAEFHSAVLAGMTLLSCVANQMRFKVTVKNTYLNIEQRPPALRVSKQARDLTI